MSTAHFFLTMDNEFETMMNRHSLPGIKYIGIVPAENLECNIMYMHIADIPVEISCTLTPIAFCGIPTCESVSTYNKNGRVEQTTLRFNTIDELPVNRHVAFVITDCNGHSYIIGQREKPHPIVKITRSTGTPGGDPAVLSVEVTLYAQKSLIQCIVS